MNEPPRLHDGIAKDPYILLHEAARSRVSAALIESQHQRDLAFAKVRVEYENENIEDGGIGFSHEIDCGKLGIKLKAAYFESIRPALQTIRAEFKAIGKGGNELSQIMRDEIEAVSNSLHLTAAQKDLLTVEFCKVEYQAPTTDHLNDSIENRIHGRLLSIHARWLEHSITARDALRSAYDIFATEFIISPSTTDETLESVIPGRVFRFALERTWVPSPRRRSVRSTRVQPNAWIPDSKATTIREEQIPETELTEMLGGYRMTSQYRSWFLRELEGRITHWTGERRLLILASMTPVLTDSVATPKQKQTFGETIDALRKERGWSFDDLAQESGVGKKLLLGYVNDGKTAYPSTLKKLADCFKVKVSDLNH